MEQHTTNQQSESSYGSALAVYILQAIAMVTAFPMFIGAIINYVKLNDARGTWIYSHFRWQLRTFWFGLLWYVIGAILSWILIGYAILAIVWIWQIYRIIKGWIRLSEHKEMYIG